MSYLAGLALKKSAIRQWFVRLNRLLSIQVVGNIVGPIVVGLALGAVVAYTRQLSSQWAGLVILATIVPTVVLLVKDLRKLLLMALVVDIVLGLDISLAERTGHKGAPSGFIVSLMTMALAAGYALWIANRPASGKSKILIHKDITIPAVIYLFTLLLSAFQAVNVRLSITQLFMEIQFFLTYFYVINHVRNWGRVRLIFSTVAGCLLFESTVMLLQHFTGFAIAALGMKSRIAGSHIGVTRIGGTIGSANGAATILAAFLVMTFAAYLANGRLVNKKLALGALLLGGPALVLTQSRSGWMAFAAGMLILTFQSLIRGIGTKAVLLLLVAGLVVGVGFHEIIIERFTTDDEGSADSRVWYIKLASNIIREHPFTGVGLNNSWEVQNDYLPIEILKIGRKWRSIIHIKYLLIWVETGFFGFFSFLWLLLAACKRAVQSLIRARDPYASIAVTSLLAAVVVYLIHMLSEPFASRARMEFLWIVFALIAATSQVIRETGRLKDPIPQFKGQFE